MWLRMLPQPYTSPVPPTPAAQPRPISERSGEQVCPGRCALQLIQRHGMVGPGGSRPLLEPSSGRKGIGAFRWMAKEPVSSPRGHFPRSVPIASLSVVDMGVVGDIGVRCCTRERKVRSATLSACPTHPGNRQRTTASSFSPHPLLPRPPVAIWASQHITVRCGEPLPRRL